MKVMIVDDSEVIRMLLVQALNMHGYHDILEAGNGMDALKKISMGNTDIGLFVLDVNMPVMNGLDLLKSIREFNRTVPIVMLTTDTDKSKMDMAKARGASGWIIKPFDTEKFIRVIRMFCKEVE